MNNVLSNVIVCTIALQYMCLGNLGAQVLDVEGVLLGRGTILYKDRTQIFEGGYEKVIEAVWDNRNFLVVIYKYKTDQDYKELVSYGHYRDSSWVKSGGGDIMLQNKGSLYYESREDGLVRLLSGGVDRYTAESMKYGENAELTGKTMFNGEEKPIIGKYEIDNDNKVKITYHVESIENVYNYTILTNWPGGVAGDSEAYMKASGGRIIELQSLECMYAGKNAQGHIKKYDTLDPKEIYKNSHVYEQISDSEFRAEDRAGNEYKISVGGGGGKSRGENRLLIGFMVFVVLVYIAWQLVIKNKIVKKS